MKLGDRFPHVSRFLEALEMERDMDLHRVEDDRTSLIRTLTGSLSRESLRALLEASLAYRAGRMTYGSYYTYLKTLCVTNKVSLSSHPAFDGYIRYVLLSEKIDPAALLDEVNLLKDAAIDFLARTPEQKEVLRMSEDLRLLERLESHDFTPADWKKYEERRKAVAAWGAEVDAESPAKVSLSGLLKPFEDFYKVASARNRYLADNFLRGMGNAGAGKGPAVTVLLAGGFHTTGLSQLLASRDISTVTIAPKITDVKEGSSYLDVFTREHTPLEKMLLGEKLFLKNWSATCPTLVPGLKSVGAPLGSMPVADTALGGENAYPKVARFEPIKVNQGQGFKSVIGKLKMNGVETRLRALLLDPGTSEEAVQRYSTGAVLVSSLEDNGTLIIYSDLEPWMARAAREVGKGIRSLQPRPALPHEVVSGIISYLNDFPHRTSGLYRVGQTAALALILLGGVKCTAFAPDDVQPKKVVDASAEVSDAEEGEAGNNEVGTILDAGSKETAAVADCRDLFPSPFRTDV